MDSQQAVSFDSQVYSNRNPSVINNRVINYSSLGTNGGNLSEYLASKPSIWHLEIELARNHSISIVIIPLLAIFYLLGAIFIFEISSDNIGNILALTLGIFALIFTLPEIINSMKPGLCNYLF